MTVYRFGSFGTNCKCCKGWNQVLLFATNTAAYVWRFLLSGGYRSFWLYKSFRYKFIQSRCKNYFHVLGLKNEEYSPTIFKRKLYLKWTKFVQFHCFTEFVTKRLLSKRLCTEPTGFSPWIQYKKIVFPRRIKVKLYSTFRKPLVVLQEGVNSHRFFDPILKMKILWLNMKSTIWSK